MKPTMDLDRWKQLDSLLQSVLERPPEERDAFLRHACAGDQPLERRVRVLLSAEPGRNISWSARLSKWPLYRSQAIRTGTCRSTPIP